MKAEKQGMKTVLVTGGTTRIGKAIAEHLRSLGWQVVTSSHRSDAGADVVADLAEPLAAAKLFAQAAACAGGKLDAIVNNAALFSGDGETLKAVNFTAPKKLTMMLAGRETGRGAVVNIVDAAALAEDAGEDSVYLRTKRDLIAFTRRSAELYAESLTVNAVAPGAVLAPEGLHVRAAESLLSARPTPQDVAEAVAYLLAAKSVTGVVLPVDAGQHLVQED